MIIKKDLQLYNMMFLTLVVSKHLECGSVAEASQWFEASLRFGKSQEEEKDIYLLVGKEIDFCQ